MADLIEVNVLGHSLKIKGPENEEVEKVASFLKGRIEDVREVTGTVDSMRLILYTAFQLADENLKIKEEQCRMEKEIDSVVSRMLDIIEQE